MEITTSFQFKLTTGRDIELNSKMYDNQASLLFELNRLFLFDKVEYKSIMVYKIIYHCQTKETIYQEIPININPQTGFVRYNAASERYFILMDADNDEAFIAIISRKSTAIETKEAIKTAIMEHYDLEEMRFNGDTGMDEIQSDSFDETYFSITGNQSKDCDYEYNIRLLNAFVY